MKTAWYLKCKNALNFIFVFWSSYCILGMFEETMQPLQWAQRKSVSPALLIRGPAISVWVVVLWCKDGKMSGSLVDQVNHALSLKQWSWAVAIIALTSWLTECSAANTWSCGRRWVPAMLAGTWQINVNSNKKNNGCGFLFPLPAIYSSSDSQTDINGILICVKKPRFKGPLQ